MMEKSINLGKLGLALFPAIFLSGCISLFSGSGEPPKYHDLTISKDVPPIHSTSNLIVETPTSPHILNGKNIVVRKKLTCGEDYLSFIKNHQWAEELPKMLQRSIVHTLRSPVWVTVSAEPVLEPVDLILRTEIIDFSVIDPDRVTVSLYLTLINNHTQKIIAARDFTTTILTPTSVSGFMRGFDQASSETLSEIQQWLRTKI